MSPRLPCADCGHDKHVHAPLVLAGPGHGCFALRRPLGSVIRVPAGCPCPSYHTLRPAPALQAAA